MHRSPKQINIQDAIFFGWLKERTRLRFELMTGRVLDGCIVRFDRYCLLLADFDSKSQVLIYKHAIAAMLAPVAAKAPHGGHAGKDNSSERRNTALARPR